MVTAVITDKPYERVIFFQATSQYYGLRTTLRTARHHWGYAQSNESRTTFGVTHNRMNHVPPL